MKKKRTKKQVKAIKINIKRRTVIVDDKLIFKNNVPIPSWIELSIIDVCNRTCKFCPKSDPSIAPDTFQKMERPLITKFSKISLSTHLFFDRGGVSGLFSLSTK